MDGLARLSMQYCARQNATAFLEIWALLLVLCGAGTVLVFAARGLQRDRQLAARYGAGALFFLAFLTAILGSSTFYGCSATAASEHGLPSNLPAHTYTVLRCLATNALNMVHGWVLFNALCTGAFVLAVLGALRPRITTRIAAFGGAALLAALSLACAFFLFIAFSLCASERLI